MTTGGEWLGLVDAHFGFLRSRGFDDVSVEDDSIWVTAAVYRSQVAAIRVCRLLELDRVEVELIRLAEGQIPTVPIWTHPDTRFDRVPLDLVVRAREPNRAAQLADLRGLDPAALTAQLVAWAQTLRDTAGDFLSGGFGSVDEAGRILQSRLREYPQQLTVSLSTDDLQTEQEVIEEMRLHTPDWVAIKVRRHG